MFYLYIKIHNKTGLKYLGKTEQEDPCKYEGSGKRWTLHIKKHGYDVTTQILKECHTKEEVKKWGIYYSKLYDVVKSKDWANIVPEQGDGGSDAAKLGGLAKAVLGYPIWNKGKKIGPRSIESVEKQRSTMTGCKRGPYKNYNYEKCGWKKGHITWNKGKKGQLPPQTAESNEKRRVAAEGKPKPSNAKNRLRGDERTDAQKAADKQKRIKK
jgi:hypothetical protein